MSLSYELYLRRHSNVYIQNIDKQKKSMGQEDKK